MKQNNLYFGDCLEIMKTIPDNHVDMVFSDLPYGTTQNPWDESIPFEKLWEQYNRIVKDNGAVVLTSQQPFTSKLIMSNIKNFRYEWIWEKNKATGHLNAKKMPMKAHENICIFYKKLSTYNPQKTIGHKPINVVKPKSNIPVPKVTRNYGHVSKTFGNDGTTTDRYPRTIQRFSVVNNDDPIKWHPTQKPIELMEYFIKTYTNEGDLVLDNCMGSGTTGVACVRTNRKFIGIEKDEKYFNLASNRIEETNPLMKFEKS